MFNLKQKFHLLKKQDVPQDALRRQRARLEVHMTLHPMTPNEKAPLLHVLAWKPVFGVLIIVFVLSGTGGVVFASQTSLPGESLYPVKIVSEELRARFAFSEDAKFRYRSKLAEKRLIEVEDIMMNTDYKEEVREKHISIAMRRYEGHVARLNGLIEKFEEQDRPKDPERALEAVHRMLGVHARLLQSATSTNRGLDILVAAYAGGAIDLEEKLIKRFEGMKKMPSGFEDRREEMEKNTFRLRARLKYAEDVRSKHFFAIEHDKNSSDDDEEVVDEKDEGISWPRAWNNRDWSRYYEISK